MTGGGTGPQGAGGEGQEPRAEQLGFEDLLGSAAEPALVPVPSPGGRGAPGRGGGRAPRGVRASAAGGVQELLLPASGDGLGGGLSAAEIARLLGRPAPTPEQTEVIEAPLEPLLVVAGAGSGKTETMAARVVWLVANGLAAPEEVLGLTFTRKAAGELAERVRSRLRALRRRLGEPGGSGAGGLAAGDDIAVTVSTYHSYAAGVLGDHGLRLGVEPGAQLLGEAAAWQLAAEVVQGWDADLAVADRTPATVTESLLGLAGECAEHLVDPGDVAAYVAALIERVEQLPAAVGDPGPGVVPSGLKERLATARRLVALVPLVQRYAERKRELGVLDFGDQVALAARLAEAAPEVAEGERARYRIVLLDEYQDTSHAQLVLLRGLFGRGHCVTAVGDPHQSIYGWRGASAGNLQAFPRDFPVVDAPGTRAAAATRYLSTSWRNDVAVLDAANAVSAPLRTAAAWVDPAEAVPVPALGGRPGAGPGEVLAAWHATTDDEVRWVAEVVEARWRAGQPGATSTGMPVVEAPTAAVLCRTRAQFPFVEAALRARGLPVEVVGLGGLLHVAEVAELRAALEVLHDPSRGDALVRLLAGPAVRLGPRDLEALALWSQELVRRWGRAPAPTLTETTHDASIVEALDELPPQGWRARSGQELSDAGRARLERLGSTLRELRGRTALALPDLVAEVERALLIDVEVTARPGVRPATARAHLDAFLEVAAGFAEAGQGRPGAGRGGASLGGFLAWLAAADERERGLDAPLTQVRPDAVQVLTVHAAKGLEWDVVAVPGLVEGTFPTGNTRGASLTSFGWLAGSFGALPYPLRGDAPRLPQWPHEAARSQADLAGSFEEFRRLARAHEVDEERRLAYVAVTRARSVLALSGAVWGEGSTPRSPSRFLEEVAALAREGSGPGGVRISTWSEPPDDGAVNPRDTQPTAQWPRRPAGRGPRGHRGGRRHGPRLPVGHARRPWRAGPTTARSPRRTSTSSWRAGTARRACCSRNARPGARGRSASSCPRTCPPRRSSRSRPTPRRSPTGCAARCRSRRSRTHGAGARSTPGWSGASGRPPWSTSRSCRARPTTPRPTSTSRSCSAGSSPASGRAAPPRRSRSPSRRRWPASSSAGGSTPCSATRRPTVPVGTSSTGRRAAPRAVSASSGPAPSSWRCTGWPGHACRACRSSTSPRRSSTRRPARRSGPWSCSTRPP